MKREEKEGEEQTNQEKAIKSATGNNQKGGKKGKKK